MSEWAIAGQWAATTPRGNWSNITYRQVLEPGSILITATKVRLTFQASNVGPLAIGACFIGNSVAGGAKPSFAVNPTRVTFGGSNSAVVPTGGTIVSDEIDFAYNPADGKTFVASWHLPTPTTPEANASRNSVGRAGLTGVNAFYITGNFAGANASEVNASNFNEDPTFDVVSVTKIEFFTGDTKVSTDFNFNYKVETTSERTDVSKYTVYGIAKIADELQVSRFSVYPILRRPGHGDIAKFSLYAITTTNVLADFAFDYSVLGEVLADFTFNYKIAEVLRDFTFDYLIAAPPMEADFDFDYAIKWVIANRTFDYRIDGNDISQDFAFNYRILGAIFADFTFDYWIDYDPPVPFQVDYRFDYKITRTGLPLVLVPEVPVGEVWSYRSGVAKSRDGTEQRAALRSEPTITLKYTYVLDNEERRALYRQILEYIPSEFIAPLYAYATRTLADMLAGNNIVYCDPTRTDIRDGDTIAILSSDDVNFAMGEVVSVGTDTVTILDGVPFDLPAGSWIMPTRRTSLSDGAGISMVSMSGSSEMSLMGNDRRAVVRPDATPNLMAMFDGLPYLDKRPLANDDVPEEFAANVARVTDAADVRPTWFQTWKMPLIEGERSYLFKRPADMDYWREFADRTKGQRGSFLTPTYRPDLVPVSVAGALLTVEGTAFASWSLHDTYSRLRFEAADGVSVRKVVSAVRSGSNTVITLNTPLSAAPISRISFINRVRLATDEIEFSHGETESIVTVKLRTVNE